MTDDSEHPIDTFPTTAPVGWAPDAFVPRPPCEALQIFIRENDDNAKKRKLDKHLQRLLEPATSTSDRSEEQLEEVSYSLLSISDLFYPWEDPVTDANKVYVAKKGGIQLLIYYTRPEFPEDIRDAAGRAIWNFGGAEIRSRAAMGEGSLTVMLDLLASDSTALKMCACGTLWSYLEFEDVQRKAVDQGIIESLIPILDFEVWEPDDGIILHAVGNFQCCAFNQHCRKQMIDAGVAESLIEKLGNRTLMTQYIGSLTLAALMLHVESEERLIKAGVPAALSKFQAAYSSHELAEDEKRQGFVWAFTSPFLQLCASHHSVVKTMGSFCMNVLSEKESNRKMMLKEDVVAPLVCHSWSPNWLVKEHMRAVLSRFLPQPGLPVPSLLQICTETVRERVWPESVPVQVLGTLPQVLIERLTFARKIK